MVYSSRQRYDTRPPMLDRSDFASWQQRIRLYCMGKDNGENIIKSIDEGPFKMGTFRETLAEGAEADIRATNILLQGLPKDIYTLINHYTDAKDIWDNVKMLLEGSELTKDERESQLYDDFEHFRQNKGETIHEYYVRFTKLINDMRNIKMTMPKMQLNSKFVNNMLPEWGRFVTAVKLNRGLKTSNYDQLYAYLKQHEAHANENKMMLERYNQHAIDPLAFVSNVSPPQYPTQSSAIPQSAYVPPVTHQPQFADNTQLDSGLTPTDDLIENLTKTVALLAQSYKTHLPQTNNQLRTSSNTRNQATVQNGRVVVQNVQGRQNRGQGNNARGAVAAGNGGFQNRGGNANLSQAKRINGQDTTLDDDVDEPLVQDLALNVDNFFQADQSDPIYDDVGPLNDSNILSEVKDHDNYIDSVGEYHEVHDMQNDVQQNYVVNSEAEYTSDSNIILCEQYVKDNVVQVIQSNVSSVPNDALMMIINYMHEQATQCVFVNEQNKVVNESLIVELTRYKEQVEIYEKKARFELTEREQKIDEQLRIIITDRNIKEESLKKELHSKENKYLEDILDMKALKEKVEDKLFKQDQSLQTIHMLCKSKLFYDEKKKVAIGYKNPLYLASAMQVQSALYNGHEIVKTNHTPTIVHDSKDTLEIAEITRKKMLEKMKIPLWIG
ncbi:hypothetical protein Tco_1432079, partial [Tanacetum coccineum]